MKKNFIVIILIWLGWACLTYWTTRLEFNEFLISSRSGVAENGECRIYRTNTVLELAIQYEGDDEITNEIIFLPSDIRCDKVLLSRLINHTVTVTVYRDYALGIAVGEDIIMHVKDNLWSVESNDYTVGYLTFIAFVASFVVLIKGPRKRGQYLWLERMRERWNK